MKPWLAGLLATAMVGGYAYSKASPAALRKWGLGGQGASFSLQDTKGKEHSLGEYYGRPVLLLRSFTACPGHPYMMALVRSVAAKYANSHLVILNLDTSNDPAAVAAAASESDAFPTIAFHAAVNLGGEHHYSGKLYPEFSPYFYLFDREGKIRHEGTTSELTEARLAELILDVLQDGSPLSRLSYQELVEQAPQDGGSARESYSEEVSRLIEDERFERLDLEASSARTERFLDGEQKISAFYGAADHLPEGLPDQKWLDRLARLERWRVARSSSVAPAASLVSFWIGFAWKARGSGTIDTVSEEGRRLFRERIERASRALEEADALAEKCGGLEELRLRVARAANWDRAKTEAAFRAAVASWPDMPGFHGEMATYLYPQWNGSDEQWLDFVREQAAAVRGEGRGNFARLVTDRFSAYYDQAGEGLASGVQWMELKASFKELLRAYPGSPKWQHHYAYWALAAGDKAAAREAFALAGHAYYPNVWRSRKRFELERRRAESDEESRGFLAALIGGSP